MLKRAELLKKIMAELATITKANNFATDLGLKVYYSQEFPVEYDGPPVLSLYDTEEHTNEVGSRHDKKLECRVDAIVFVESDPITEGCDALADIIQLLGRDRQWGKLAVNTYLGDNLKEVDLSGSRAVRITQEFVVQYRVEAFES
jgi:hypothetical protein